MMTGAGRAVAGWQGVLGALALGLGMLMAPAAQAQGPVGVGPDAAPAPIGTVAPIAPDFFWPGVEHDPSIPTMQQVLGHGPGQRLSTSAQAVRYLEALASAAPDRVRLFTYGQSWQGRPLVGAVIGSPARIADLDGIRAGMARLADPRGTSAAEADALIARLPAIVWLAYVVHGNEPSGTDAGLMTAHHLLAARNDPRLESIRANALTVIIPVQNPDGRDRFIAANTDAQGVAPDPGPLAAERDEPWPSGRQNHYAFDLNRDWFAQTQPETRAHARLLLEWHPLVIADVHEMGTNEQYFFPPEADPINPNITAAQQAAKDRIGRTTAGWFDRFGIPYFTRETFDAFYPGYGDGWPTYHGMIAMTYEQGSARGLVARRNDGSLLTYATSVRNQFVSSMATVEAAARDRETLLRAFWDYRRTAIEEGRRERVRAYAFPAGGDRTASARLAALLARQGVEVVETTDRVRACGTTLEPGSFLISAAQPTKRLLRVLLEPRCPAARRLHPAPARAVGTRHG